MTLFSIGNKYPRGTIKPRAHYSNVDDFLILDFCDLIEPLHSTIIHIMPTNFVIFDVKFKAEVHFKISPTTTLNLAAAMHRSIVAFSLPTMESGTNQMIDSNTHLLHEKYL